LSDSAATKESTSTLDNLQTAFNGESNANARYVAFAVLLQKPKKSTPAITVT
jgi:rubrerythrin